jgi:N-ethylmaleimide reductase
MSTLFASLKVGDLTLKNRIIMAPMTRSRADDDGVQPDFVADYYAQRATAGLIISEAVNVSPMAKGYVRTPGVYSREQIDSWRPVAKAVHENGGKIFMQLFHTGRIALPDLLPNNALPLAPSTVRAKGQNYTDAGMKDFVEPRSMTVKEIKQTVQDFATASRNAVEAGFDGVEIHSASGYLIQQFLMKPVNQRSDDYGGSVQNRARFLFEIIDAAAAEIGSQRIGVKFSPALPFNDIEEPDAEDIYLYIARELSGKNIAYVHVADGFGGKWHELFRTNYDGLYFAGSGFTQESGEEYISSGQADAIVYGAKFIANPDLPIRFDNGATLNEPDISTYYSGGVKGYLDYPQLSRGAAG